MKFKFHSRAKQQNSRSGVSKGGGRVKGQSVAVGTKAPFLCLEVSFERAGPSSEEVRKMKIYRCLRLNSHVKNEERMPEQSSSGVGKEEKKVCSN